MLLFWGCRQEKETSEQLDYAQLIEPRLKNLRGIDIEKIEAVSDTLSFFIVNHKRSYFSEVEFNQIVKYLFQDFSSLQEEVSHQNIRFLYKMPQRDSLNYSLYETKTSSFISSLAMFNDQHYKKLINDL